MQDHRPIRIAGAGPSGLAAAIALARAGRAVEVHEAKADVGTRGDVGALRIVTRATADLPCADYPGAGTPEVILELDYWALMPR